MRLLQRYILVELLRVFGLLLIGVTGLVLLAGVVQEAAASGLRPVDLVRIVPFIVLSLTPFTIPATLLLAICIVYGRLSADHELTAARAAGVSTLRLLTPAFLLALLLSGLTFLLKDQGIPFGIRSIQAIAAGAIEEVFLNRLASEGQLNEPHLGYSIAAAAIRDGQLIDAQLRMRSPSGELTIVTAATAEIRIDTVLRQVAVGLQKGHVLLGTGGRYEFDRNVLSFPYDLTPLAWKARHVSIREVSRQIRNVEAESHVLQQQRAQTMAYATLTGDFNAMQNPILVRGEQMLEFNRRTVCRCRKEVHNRVSLSAGCLLFAIVGGPFAMLRGSRHPLTTFLFCFLPITLGYYPVVLLMMNLSDTGVIAAWWSAWIANLLLLAVGAYLLRRVMLH